MSKLNKGMTVLAIFVALSFVYITTTNSIPKQATEASNNFEISVHAFQKLQEADPSQQKYRVLDVRQPYEAEIASIPNSILIPLDQLENRYNELDPSQTWIVYCASGARSQKAVDLLKEKGFTKSKNLTGGIIEYAKKIDRSLKAY